MSVGKFSEGRSSMEFFIKFQLLASLSNSDPGKKNTAFGKFDEHLGNQDEMVIGCHRTGCLEGKVDRETSVKLMEQRTEGVKIQDFACCLALICSV